MEIDGNDVEQKGNYIDRDVIGRYFSREEMDKIKAYAKDNGYDTGSKEDLMAILDFCQELRSKKD
jgi:hypothetical protein